jgi:hypothetical protein
MAVYVDNYKAAFGRMTMCHMMADTRDELLQMVDKIGVQRRWIQKAGTHQEHFDVCLSKRDKAVAAGAIELHAFDLVRRMLAKQRAAQAPRDPAPAMLAGLAALRRERQDAPG